MESEERNRREEDRKLGRWEERMNDRKSGREEAGPNNSWRSLSFAPYLTKVVLYKILAYGLILFLVIKNVERYDLLAG